jgi:predicted acylesterase/phospholipase RssA
LPTRIIGSGVSGEKPFRVLALDGGGMRGLYTAKVLDALTHRFSEKPAAAFDPGAAFDLIVGTSTGGILTCALAAGISIGKVAALYEAKGCSVFPHPVPNRKNKAGSLFFAATHLNSPANDGVGLHDALVDLFGTATIGETYARRKIAFCIQALEMATHAPIVFKSGHLEGKHRDDTMTLVDACMATTAAPIIFPPARVKVAGADRVMCDGGLWANSPILPGLIEALKICGDCTIQVVSVGTCPPPVGTFIPKDGAWGLAKWKFGLGIVEASIDAQAGAAEFQFEQLRPHLRVDASLVRLHQTAPPEDHQNIIGLDRADPKAIDAMKQLAERDADTIHGEATAVDSEIAFLKEIFTNLPEVEQP